jgi:hypothetical protein
VRTIWTIAFLISLTRQSRNRFWIIMREWDWGLLIGRQADQIAGVLSCYDRILIFGTLPNICFAEGMTSYLYSHQVRIFDYPRYPRFAQPFREELRMNAERLARRERESRSNTSARRTSAKRNWCKPY